MSLVDYAERVARDYKRERSDKRWRSHLLAAKLLDLRDRRGLTQKEVAQKAGVKETTLANYEQQKSFPKQDHLELIAAALDVRPEALTLYDFFVGSIQANALFQLGETYGFKPGSAKEYAFLQPTTLFTKSFLEEWLEKYRDLADGRIDRSQYEDWKDSFDCPFDPCEFPSRYVREASGEYRLVEPWQNVCFARALQRLRKEHIPPFTQAELAAAVDSTESAMRSYEQMKRLPKAALLQTMAVALNVTEGALTFFDFGSPVQAAHATFQLANTYGLVPEARGGAVVLRTKAPGVETTIDCWADMLTTCMESGDKLAYQHWKDTFDPEKTEFRCGHESRYCPAFTGGDKRRTAQETEYEPFDPRYPKDGFLRA